MKLLNKESLQNIVSTQQNKTINVSSKELGKSDMNQYDSNYHLQTHAGQINLNNQDDLPQEMVSKTMDVRY